MDTGTDPDIGSSVCIQVVTSNRHSNRLTNNTGRQGVNLRNLRLLSPSIRWNIPSLLNVNARSLSTEKMDELLNCGG